MTLTREQVSEIKKAVQESIGSICTDKNFISSLASAVSQIISSDLKEVIRDQERQITELQQEINDLTSKCNSYENKFDYMEQYSRRHNIRIFGVEEKRGEDTEDVVTKLFKEKLNLQLQRSCIDRCHRVGRGDGNRPIIVKFTNHSSRLQVLSSRKMLKVLE